MVCLRESCVAFGSAPWYQPGLDLSRKGLPFRKTSWISEPERLWNRHVKEYERFSRNSVLLGPDFDTSLDHHQSSENQVCRSAEHRGVLSLKGFRIFLSKSMDIIAGNSVLLDPDFDTSLDYQSSGNRFVVVQNTVSRSLSQKTSYNVALEQQKHLRSCASGRDVWRPRYRTQHRGS